MYSSNVSSSIPPILSTVSYLPPASNFSSPIPTAITVTIRHLLSDRYIELSVPTGWKIGQLKDEVLRKCGLLDSELEKDSRWGEQMACRGEGLNLFRGKKKEMEGKEMEESLDPFGSKDGFLGRSLSKAAGLGKGRLKLHVPPAATRLTTKVSWRNLLSPLATSHSISRYDSDSTPPSPFSPIIESPTTPRLAKLPQIPTSATEASEIPLPSSPDTSEKKVSKTTSPTKDRRLVDSSIYIFPSTEGDGNAPSYHQSDSDTFHSPSTFSKANRGDPSIVQECENYREKKLAELSSEYRLMNALLGTNLDDDSIVGKKLMDHDLLTLLPRSQYFDLPLSKYAFNPYLKCSAYVFKPATAGITSWDSSPLPSIGIWVLRCVEVTDRKLLIKRNWEDTSILQSFLLPFSCCFVESSASIDTNESSPATLKKHKIHLVTSSGVTCCMRGQTSYDFINLMRVLGEERNEYLERGDSEKWRIEVINRTHASRHHYLPLKNESFSPPIPSIPDRKSYSANSISPQQTVNANRHKRSISLTSYSLMSRSRNSSLKTNISHPTLARSSTDSKILPLSYNTSTRSLGRSTTALLHGSDGRVATLVEAPSAKEEEDGLAESLAEEEETLLTPKAFVEFFGARIR